jgi:hypothetical protein
LQGRLETREEAEVAFKFKAHQKAEFFLLWRKISLFFLRPSTD